MGEQWYVSGRSWDASPCGGSRGELLVMGILIIHYENDLVDFVSPGSKRGFRPSLFVTNFGLCFAMLSNWGRVLFILCADNPGILASTVSS